MGSLIPFSLLVNLILDPSLVVTTKIMVHGTNDIFFNMLM